MEKRTQKTWDGNDGVGRSRFSLHGALGVYCSPVVAGRRPGGEASSGGPAGRCTRSLRLPVSLADRQLCRSSEASPRGLPRRPRRAPATPGSPGPAVACPHRPRVTEPARRLLPQQYLSPVLASVDQRVTGRISDTAKAIWMRSGWLRIEALTLSQIQRCTLLLLQHLRWIVTVAVGTHQFTTRDASRCHSPVSRAAHGRVYASSQSYREQTDRFPG